MLYFLSQRVDRIRQAVNPDAGVILAHHTRKLGKKQFEEDPFQALAGAGSLRGYYSTGMLLFRPDESRTTRQLIFELRNGAGIPIKHVDKLKGEWREVDPGDRLVMKEYGERLDAERRRKRDAILEILFQEAAKGNCYTANQFAESFEGKAGLGASARSASGFQPCRPKPTSSISAMRRTTACLPVAAPSLATSVSRTCCCAHQMASLITKPGRCPCASSACFPPITSAHSLARPCRSKTRRCGCTTTI
jgi:hypothetical protein